MKKFFEIFLIAFCFSFICGCSNSQNSQPFEFNQAYQSDSAIVKERGFHTEDVYDNKKNVYQNKEVLVMFNDNKVKNDDASYKCIIYNDNSKKTAVLQTVLHKESNKLVSDLDIKQDKFPYNSLYMEILKNNKIYYKSELKKVS